MVRLKTKRFLKKYLNYNFNSNMVRLKQNILYFANKYDIFQFQLVRLKNTFDSTKIKYKNKSQKN